MCIKIYIFCFKQKNIRTQKQKAKETKENTKTKETKEEKKKENMMMSFYNLLCVLSTDISKQKECVLNNNKLWKASVHICLLFIEDKTKIC